MGVLINLPQPARAGRRGKPALLEPATVIILPVVRIERHSDKPANGTPRRRRKRRAVRN